MRPSFLYGVKHEVNFQDSLDDLLISKSHWLVAITTLLFSVTTIIVTGPAPMQVMLPLFLLSMGFTLISVLAYRLMEIHYLLAHFIWQTNLVMMVLAVTLILHNPDILLIITFLPLIAAISLGLGPGLMAEMLVTGIVLLAQNGVIFSPLPAFTILMIPLLGFFGGLLGWIATNHLMEAANWAILNYSQAQNHLTEARQERMDLKQAQEDLLKANLELARLANRLKSLQQIAEEARQAKVEFVSNVSHELRTPLNMIIGFTEVMTQTPELYGGRISPALMADISAVQRNSQHLLTLVNDVLDLSQVDAGQMALSREWNSLTQIIELAVEVVRSLYDSKRLYIHLNLEANLPEFFCDPIRIRQVIINLLSNAGRFTSQGGVTICCTMKNDTLVVSITDTGLGIPREAQDRIFEPFQQLDNSTRRLYGGSGLGLAISKQFIELHGGKMWLDSQVGNGTTIYFSLPLATNLELETEFTNKQARRGVIPGDEYGYSLRTRPSKAPVIRPLPRLVVLEQGHTLQHLLKRYLADTEVVGTHSLESATQALNQSPAQALLVNLPVFQNISNETLAITPYGTPVISCWVPGEDEAAEHLGALQYLLKPVTREKILAVLDDLHVKQEVPGDMKVILVVDDEPDELQLFSRILESAGKSFQVIQVTNGMRALDIMRSRKIDILLLDLMLPGINGFQVMEEKRKDPAIRDIPVIIISSRDPQGEAITNNMILLGHNGGFSTRNLLDLIRAVVGIIIPETSN